MTATASHGKPHLTRAIAAERHKLAFYPETQFGEFSNYDGTVAFYTRVNALLRPSSVVVDFGCGRGEHVEDPVEFRRKFRCLKGRVANVIGIDVDAAGCSNPTIDEFRLLENGENWPLPERSVDVVICDSVLEHILVPRLFFAEAARVLGEGGMLCIRTTNLLSYVGVAAKLLPGALHKSVLRRVQGIRKDEDIFPTVYRCNTITAVRRALRQNGFCGTVYGHTAEPSYLSFSKVAYAVGVLHQKFAPSMFATTIFAFGRKAS